METVVFPVLTHLAFAAAAVFLSLVGSYGYVFGTAPNPASLNFVASERCKMSTSNV